MDVESLGRKAIGIIKETWGIPERGFIAGGSISNIIWELVSGNKAIINDIDVFLLNGEILISDANDIILSGKKLSYVDKDLTYMEDYQGLTFISTPKEFYTIESSEKEGIFNYIKYSSSTPSPKIVIESFDINCTSIGYSIEEDKFYWLKSFEDFLETGELKVTSLTTPCHTAIRICKKQDELNAKLDELEYSMLSYTISNRFVDINKIRFSTRYHDLYEKYKSNLPPYEIHKDCEVEKFLKAKNIDIDLYYFSAPFNILDDVFKDSNIKKISTGKHFLFYMRNIYNNSKLMSIWEKTRYFFTNEDYIDETIFDTKDLELLSKIAEFAPNTINNLMGHRLSDQIKFIRQLFEKFKEDPLIGVAILEKHKMCDINLDDDSGLLVLELSVRKRLVNVNNTRLGKIIERRDNEYSNLDNNIIPHWI